MGTATFKNILSDLGSVSTTEHANQKQRVDLLTDTFVFILFCFYFCVMIIGQRMLIPKITRLIKFFMTFLPVMDELDISTRCICVPIPRP